MQPENWSLQKDVFTHMNIIMWWHSLSAVERYFWKSESLQTIMGTLCVENFIGLAQQMQPLANWNPMRRNNCSAAASWMLLLLTQNTHVRHFVRHKCVLLTYICRQVNLLFTGIAQTCGTITCKLLYTKSSPLYVYLAISTCF